MSAGTPNIRGVDEGWTALAAALAASALTIAGTWVVSWRHDRRAERNNRQAELAATVQQVTSLSFDVTLRAHVAATLGAHYESPLTSLSVLVGLERRPDVLALLDQMMTTMQDLGAANARLWLSGDQELVAAGNAVQQRAADVIGSIMGTSGAGSAVDTEAILQPLNAARHNLVHVARRQLGQEIIQLATE